MKVQCFSSFHLDRCRQLLISIDNNNFLFQNQLPLISLKPFSRFKHTQPLLILSEPSSRFDEIAGIDLISHLNDGWCSFIEDFKIHQNISTQTIFAILASFIEGSCVFHWKILVDRGLGGGLWVKYSEQGFRFTYNFN